MSPWLSQKNALLVTVATSTPTTRMGIRTCSFQPLLKSFPCTQPDPHTPIPLVEDLGSLSLCSLFCKEPHSAFKPGAGLGCKGTCSSSPSPSLLGWHHQLWLKVLSFSLLQLMQYMGCKMADDQKQHSKMCENMQRCEYTATVREN